MRRALALFTTVGLLVGMLTFIFSAPASAIVDKDCSDFDTQAQAQAFYINAGGPGSDPHQLDADDDGIACDSLPCPCSSSTGGGGSSTGGTTVRQRAKVLRVLDGDTVRVRLASGARRTVRMIGIDTPEVYGTVECGGPQASQSLKRMLPRGTRVRLISDPTQAMKDRYGRILRYVERIRDGRDMDRAQVYRGWAAVYVYNNKPFKRVSSYRNAQSSAKAANRGIWGLC